MCVCARVCVCMRVSSNSLCVCMCAWECVCLPCCWLSQLLCVTPFTCFTCLYSCPVHSKRSSCICWTGDQVAFSCISPLLITVAIMAFYWLSVYTLLVCYYLHYCLRYNIFSNVQISVHAVTSRVQVMRQKISRALLACSHHCCVGAHLTSAKETSCFGKTNAWRVCRRFRRPYHVYIGGCIYCLLDIE